jgi:hypothetical protein
VSQTLKSCAHCGGESEVVKHQYGGYYPRCMTPGCINELGAGRTYSTAVSAVNAWNARPPQTDEEPESVERALQRERNRITDGMNMLPKYGVDVPDGNVLTIRLYDMYNVIHEVQEP